MPSCWDFGLLQSECVEYGHSPSFLQALVQRQISLGPALPQQRHVRPGPHEPLFGWQDSPASPGLPIDASPPDAEPSAGDDPSLPLLLPPPLLLLLAPPPSAAPTVSSSLEPPQCSAAPKTTTAMTRCPRIRTPGG